MWLTLIRSNPSFKTERTRFFFKYFNRANKPVEEVAAIFRQIDLMVNRINEKTGKNIDSEEMYLMVISMMNDGNDTLQDIDVFALYDEMEQMVFKYQPEVYSPDTVRVLRHLKQTEGATLSILSNTGFIKGRTLRKILERMELGVYFDFQLYSDETGLSKPEEKLFRLMLDRVADTRKASVDPKRVIHIGDNPVADILGAGAVGIDSLLVNSNQLSILSLLTK